MKTVPAPYTIHYDTLPQDCQFLEMIPSTTGDSMLGLFSVDQGLCVCEMEQTPLGYKPTGKRIVVDMPKLLQELVGLFAPNQPKIGKHLH